MNSIKRRILTRRLMEVIMDEKISGRTDRQICEAHGIRLSDLHAALSKYLDQTIALTAPQYRAIQQNRYEEMVGDLWNERRDEEGKLKLQVYDRLGRLLKDLTDLTGAKAPVRVEVDTEVKVYDMREVIGDRISNIRRRFETPLAPSPTAELVEGEIVEETA